MSTLSFFSLQNDCSQVSAHSFAHSIPSLHFSVFIFSAFITNFLKERFLQDIINMKHELHNKWLTKHSHHSFVLRAIAVSVPFESFIHSFILFKICSTKWFYSSSHAMGQGIKGLPILNGFQKMAFIVWCFCKDILAFEMAKASFSRFVYLQSLHLGYLFNKATIK